MPKGIKYFIWGYQPHFVAYLRSASRDALKSLDKRLDPEVFLVGIRVEQVRLVSRGTVLRYTIAVPLLAIALLKSVDWLHGEFQPLSSMVALFEVFLAVALVVSSTKAKSVLRVAAVFLLITVAAGALRSLGAAGIEGKCGCAGNTIPLRNWQQLLMSSALLLLVGSALLVENSPKRCP